MDTPSQPFSIRTGARIPPQLGLQDMPRGLRTSLWNVIQPWIFESSQVDEYRLRAQWIWNFHAIKWRADEIPTHSYRYRATEQLGEWFFAAEWHAIYDFVEALPTMVLAGVGANNLNQLRRHSTSLYDYASRTISKYIRDLNSMLAREGAPYRYQSGHLLPVTNELELEALADAVSKTPFNGARMHLEQAMSLISARPEPDYRNTIKEAVSAIESLLQEATNMKGESLPALLRAFESRRQTELHGGFKSALLKLYGWTSDDSGIRHGIFGDDRVERPEAQFMLITCSAFINFLVAKASEP